MTWNKNLQQRCVVSKATSWKKHIVELEFGGGIELGRFLTLATYLPSCLHVGVSSCSVHKMLWFQLLCANWLHHRTRLHPSGPVPGSCRGSLTSCLSATPFAPHSTQRADVWYYTRAFRQWPRWCTYGQQHGFVEGRSWISGLYYKTNQRCRHGTALVCNGREQ